jgi:hypothetical protein
MPRRDKLACGRPHHKPCFSGRGGRTIVPGQTPEAHQGFAVQLLPQPGWCTAAERAFEHQVLTRCKEAGLVWSGAQLQGVVLGDGRSLTTSDQAEWLLWLMTLSIGLLARVRISGLSAEPDELLVVRPVGCDPGDARFADGWLEMDCGPISTYAACVLYAERRIPADAFLEALGGFRVREQAVQRGPGPRNLREVPHAW